MTRGAVLPFPARLTQGDREGLHRFAVAFPGAQIDILIGRNHREIATLALAGRRVWLERDATGLRAREPSSGRLLAEGTAISGVLAAIQAALLPGGTAVWRSRPAALC
jgi:hypothetical protein